jgi:hypothetical protein
MGFVLSVLYLLVNYLTPPVVFGPLAQARVELITATLLFFVSLPKLQGSLIFKTIQTAAVVGIMFAGSFSVLFGEGWAGGALMALPNFLPSALAYFVICLHCNSKKKLQVIVLMLLFVCLFVIAHGYIDLHQGLPEAGASRDEDTRSAEAALWDRQHPYLLRMGQDQGKQVYRLRGLGLINDPNDFGQLVVCVIPLVFILWRPRRMVRNIVLVLLPVSVLLFGVFLSHSRGALLALLALAVVAARRRVGTLPALMLAAGLFFAAMALHFTGGRDISAESGSDRTALWSEGLELLKSHPLFGVGIGQMQEYTSEHLTAHNTVVVCAVELGLTGLYFWSLFLFASLRDSLAVASLPKVGEAVPIASEGEPSPQGTGELEAIDRAEVKRMGRLVVLSFTGFLVAGWFLSRAYVMTFFLLGGIAEVVYEMALQRGMIAPRLPKARVLSYSGIFAISLVLLMYILLRLTNLMH